MWGKKSSWVTPDADLQMAVNAMLTSFFGCAGQRYLAGSISVPLGDVYEPLKEKFVKSASKLKVGYGLNEDVSIGPLVSKEHMEKILNYIDIGVKEGAKLLLDGRNVKVEGYPKGLFPL